MSAASDAYNDMTSCGCKEARDVQSSSVKEEAKILAFKEHVTKGSFSPRVSLQGSFSPRVSLQHCVVCLKAPIGKGIEPCGHVCVCVECAIAIKACPIPSCRAPATGDFCIGKRGALSTGKPRGKAPEASYFDNGGNATYALLLRRQSSDASENPADVESEVVDWESIKLMAASCKA